MEEKELLAQEKEQDTWAAERRNRLPTFREVLARHTRPPVDLFMFYLFLQREGAEDVLDFWLDVQQHENLCRAYFKDLKKSGKAVKDEWPQYYDFARRRGSIYGTVVGIPGGKRSTVSSASADASASDEEKRARHDSSRPGTSTQGHAAAATATAAGLSGRATTSPRASGMSPYDWTGPTPVDPTMGGTRSLTPFSGRFGRYSSMAKRLSARAPTIIPRDGPVTHSALIASAERLFARYLVPGAEKEIYLPPSLRIHSFILNSDNPPPIGPATAAGQHQAREEYEMEQAALAQVPDMFHAQKEYIFGAMEQDAYPRFLRAKAFGNLTPVSALVRLVLGLVVLWIGLSTGFALIFLDVQPKAKRWFLFIPFTLAVLLLVSHSYELDPLLLLLANQSETTPFRTLGVREPYVRRLLVGRSIWVLVLVSVIATVLTVIFWAVPGHRL